MSDLFQYQRYDEIKENFQGVGLLLSDSDKRLFDSTIARLNELIVLDGENPNREDRPRMKEWKEWGELFAVRQELLENGVINKEAGYIACEGIESEPRGSVDFDDFNGR